MLKQLIKSDLYRYSGSLTLRSFIQHYLCTRGFNFSFWLRMASSNGWLGQAITP